MLQIVKRELRVEGKATRESNIEFGIKKKEERIKEMNIRKKRVEEEIK